jgi:hypothetical protein
MVVAVAVFAVGMATTMEAAIRTCFMIVMIVMMNVEIWFFR